VLLEDVLLVPFTNTMAQDDPEVSVVTKDEEETTFSTSLKESSFRPSSSPSPKPHRKHDDDLIKGTLQNCVTVDVVEPPYVTEKEDIPKYDMDSSLTTTIPPPHNKAETVYQYHQADGQYDDDTDSTDEDVPNANNQSSSHTTPESKLLHNRTVPQDAQDEEDADDAEDDNGDKKDHVLKQEKKFYFNCKTTLKEKNEERTVIKEMYGYYNQVKKEKIIECPSVQDILVGMDHSLKAHPGNQRMVAIIAVHRDRYEATDKDGKKKIVKEIISELQRGDARFVKVNESGTGWVKCRLKETREKGTHRRNNVSIRAHLVGFVRCHHVITLIFRRCYFFLMTYNSQSWNAFA
jgi:hypothetical protein